MGAVRALLVIVVGDVQALIYVVEAEGNLGVEINVAGAQFAVDGGGVQFRENGSDGISGGGHGHILAQSGEVGVVGVQTGIDDGDLHAFTGITGSPGALTADHHTIGGGIGLCGFTNLVNRLNQNLLNAFHCQNLLNGAVGHIGGDAVQQPGIVVVDLQRLAIQDSLLDVFNDLGLLFFQFFDDLFGTGVEGCLAVKFNNRQAIHDDQNLNDLIIGNKLLHGESFILQTVLREFRVDCGAIQFLKGQIGNFIGSNFLCEYSAHGCQRQNHAQREHKCQNTLEIHHLMPLLSYLPLPNQPPMILRTISTHLPMIPGTPGFSGTVGLSGSVGASGSSGFSSRLSMASFRALVASSICC